MMILWNKIISWGDGFNSRYHSFKNIMAKHNEVGEIGEEVACKFLVKRGFEIVDRNYRKKWGELDIIAKEGGKLHFIEVKTVSRENVRSISRETLEQDKPEERIHEQKQKRLARAIQTYLSEKHVSRETYWQIDTIAVFLDLNNKDARIRFMDNIIM